MNKVTGKLSKSDIERLWKTIDLLFDFMDNDGAKAHAKQCTMDSAWDACRALRHFISCTYTDYAKEA